MITRFEPTSLSKIDALGAYCDLNLNDPKIILVLDEGKMRV
jgi:hypothetical protein